MRTSGICERAYEIGRGKLQAARARAPWRTARRDASCWCITEMPYQVNKAAHAGEDTEALRGKENSTGCIYDIRDESDRTGMRAVIELKKDVDPERTVLACLYKYSDMQITFGVNMVAIADGKPRQLWT